MTWLRLAVVLMVTATLVAGCGRRGALQPPPGAPEAVTPRGDIGNPGSSDRNFDDLTKLDEPTVTDKDGDIATRRAEEAEKTHGGRRFILDPLI
ncbi:putative small lipoprotein YifL [Rhodopseudomonas julia]|uniref:Small lipoprotein YifL n=1 Tax=Rhodopseudomonas julia TaxID=200617 RepID=A0ABU0C5C8_9BRAD|nr:lipoprotein [Rhodopseudomonas julia]MDQ0325714.1 putative small lipoprotein YifL [Rhodopseudomonas julia]